MGEVSREFLLIRQEKLIEESHQALEHFMTDPEPDRDEFYQKEQAIINQYNINQEALISTQKEVSHGTKEVI
jgi:hypothetical protein